VELAGVLCAISGFRESQSIVPLTPLSPLLLPIAVPTLRLDVSDEEGAAEATVTNDS
jgi:hypothetical protein